MLVEAVCGGMPQKFRLKIQDHQMDTISIKYRYFIETTMQTTKSLWRGAAITK
jgi:hypothetical protein